LIKERLAIYTRKINGSKENKKKGNNEKGDGNYNSPNLIIEWTLPANKLKVVIQEGKNGDFNSPFGQDNQSNQMDKSID